jgi:hypothetical protein
MKKLLFLFIIFTFNSCEIYYDGETRLIIDTVVKDIDDGTPLKNIPFKVIVTNGYDTETISTGFSDNEGKILAAFPAPKSDSDLISLEISPKEIYEKLEFVRILKSDFTNYKLSPISNGLTKKDRITNLNLEIIQTSSQIALSDLAINAIRPELVIDYNPEYEDDPLNWYFYPISILKNQTFNLTYKLTDFSVNPASVEYFSIPISVENESINYQLIY